MLDRDGTDIDLSSALTLAKAQSHLRGRSRTSEPSPPAIDTIRRWIKKGAVIRGVVVRLRAALVNGEWLTTANWCREFEQRRVRAGERRAPPLCRPERSRRAGAGTGPLK